MSGETGVPCVGDDVDFRAGRVVIGNIDVGDHTRIGALAVVTKSLV